MFILLSICSSRLVSDASLKNDFAAQEFPTESHISNKFATTWFAHLHLKANQQRVKKDSCRREISQKCNAIQLVMCHLWTRLYMHVYILRKSIPFIEASHRWRNKFWSSDAGQTSCLCDKGILCMFIIVYTSVHSVYSSPVQARVGEGRAFRFSKIFTDFSLGVSMILFWIEKDLGKVSNLRNKNCMDTKKVILYSENGKISKKSWFYIIKQAILRSGSFQL